LRTKYIHKVDNAELFKQQLLVWSQQFDEVVWLDSNNYQQTYSSFDAILAVDAVSSIRTDYHHAFTSLKNYQSQCSDWIFGYLSYDLKNDVESLESTNFDGLDFPDLYFFQPKKVFLFHGNDIVVLYLDQFQKDIKTDLKAINNTFRKEVFHEEDSIKIKLRIHKDEYFEKVNKILEHIHRGDIYEANFCQEFYAEDTSMNPLETYFKLNTISKPPFATFFKCNDKFLLSASPERYLKKEGNTVISQPIKGTEKRASTKKEDQKLIKELEQNPKERAENIMIVDLVRNDLSRIAIKGSVKVDELCKVYTFEQVHQLISTISCKVDNTYTPR